MKQSKPHQKNLNKRNEILASKRLILPITNRERFHRPPGTIYAALSVGTPAFMYAIDYSTFQKSPKEKALVVKMKSELPKTKSYSWTLISKSS